MELIELRERVDRDSISIACSKCNGLADRVDCAPEEDRKFNCGLFYECCSRAFICRVCGARLVGKAESPNMNYWD